MSFVDLNRSGVALMEIVSKPDMRSADEAKAYVSKLRTILRYIGSCDGDMEKGNLRADVNVSVRRPGEPLGTRCEIKNVNSIRFIGQAIEAEARRQIEIIEDGGTIEQETRLFDPGRGETRSMRSKEEAHDYRYFPDPDLLPLELDRRLGRRARGRSAGAARRQEGALHRRLRALGLRRGGARRRARDGGLSSRAPSSTAARKRDAKAVANWLMGDLAAQANAQGRRRRGRGPQRGVARDARRSHRRRRDLRQDRQGRARPAARRRRRAPIRARSSRRAALRQVTDAGAIERAVDAVIAANPDKAEQAKAKPGMLGWFVGQVMKATGGKANPQAVSDPLKQTTRPLERSRIAHRDLRDSRAQRRVGASLARHSQQNCDSRLPRKIRLPHACARRIERAMRARRDASALFHAAPTPKRAGRRSAARARFAETP